MMRTIHSGTILKLIAIVLVLIAFVLGFLIIKTKFYPSLFGTKKPVAVQTVTVTGGVPNALLVLSSQNSTPQEKQAYLEVVKSAAIATSTISIATCVPNPLVAKVVQDSKVNFTNTGKESLKVMFDKGRVLDIVPGDTKSIVARFDQGPAVYGYGCGSSKSAVGQLIVVK